jgi:hypothetical protein
MFSCVPSDKSMHFTSSPDALICSFRILIGYSFDVSLFFRSNPPGIATLRTAQLLRLKQTCKTQLVLVRLDLTLWVDSFWKEFRQSYARRVRLFCFLFFGLLLFLLFLSFGLRICRLRQLHGMNKKSPTTSVGRLIHIIINQFFVVTIDDVGRRT